MFKDANGLAPPFMANIFGTTLAPRVCKYSEKIDFCNHVNPKTTDYEVGTLRCLGPKIWNMVPDEIKNYISVPSFKRKI